eukprot:5990070-Amphidinium_carterae.1
MMIDDDDDDDDDHHHHRHRHRHRHHHHKASRPLKSPPTAKRADTSLLYSFVTHIAAKYLSLNRLLQVVQQYCTD